MFCIGDKKTRPIEGIRKSLPPFIWEKNFDGKLFVPERIKKLKFWECGVNYLVYLKILKSRKEKYAFEITELAKEISEE